ncbi:Periplasmic solute binding protein [Nitrosotalea sinensis]|uniref:Periplasmic solute binding protein n=1 Tax=Nitrosotalea sinensis TaxID=1499975 RepID=A0A2H1EG20_9ARCH|nr:zinc ABC transporter substrate-binding protein [Candidatus Nitrosotalea sinensis]SHO43913.1 Periplasmic solute binding protein [Candidatus Nitrosotalea sinensis]
MLNIGVKTAILSIIVVIPLSGYVLWLSEQNRENIQQVSEHHEILVTFYPIYKFTKAVGGDKVDVSVIIPSGVEPHDWEPTVQDIEHLKKANMIIINGAGLEPWISKLVSENPNITIIDSSKNIHLLENNENTNMIDPHIWLDPILAKIQVQNIADGLINIDPTNADYYQQNANQYKAKLDLLDNQIRTELGTCNKKDFLAFHDAFSYFSKEYGLNQNTIVGGLNPEAEPTAQTLQEIVNKAHDLGIHVIFTEEAVNPQISKVIADEIHGKVLVLSPLEVTNTHDDYVEKMQDNLSNLKEALCS